MPFEDFKRLQLAQLLCKQFGLVWTGITDNEREVFMDSAEMSIKLTEIMLKKHGHQ